MTQSIRATNEKPGAWPGFSYLPFGAAFPLPPPEGLPVVLGRFGTAGALEPPPLPLFPVDPEPLLPLPDLDMSFSLLQLRWTARETIDQSLRCASGLALENVACCFQAGEGAGRLSVPWLG